LIPAASAIRIASGDARTGEAAAGAAGGAGAGAGAARGGAAGFALAAGAGAARLAAAAGAAGFDSARAFGAGAALPSPSPAPSSSPLPSPSAARHGDHGADIGALAGGDGDLAQHTAVGRLELDVGLVGFDLRQRLALRHRVALAPSSSG
jgi:hypothetical protein